MTTELKCPVCASANVTTTEEKKRTVQGRHGPVLYDALVDTCSDCGERGDFNNGYDHRIEAALAKENP